MNQNQDIHTPPKRSKTAERIGQMIVWLSIAILLFSAGYCAVWIVQKSVHYFLMLITFCAAVAVGV